MSAEEPTRDGPPPTTAGPANPEEDRQPTAAVVVDEVKEEVKKELLVSEYDSIGSYGAEKDDDADVDDDEGSGESEGGVGLEREEGDGQESIPAKKVDDDEDKKNPQYIPKRGTFYEHDDRTGDDADEKEELDDKDKEKKKVWQDKKEKWSHDKFNDNEQAPKSRAELIAIYGYDIRNEDGPPKARRRRRYGRGPNKYTRNWEDVDAYNKPTVVRKPIKKERSKKSSETGEDGEEVEEDQQQQQHIVPQEEPHHQHHYPKEAEKEVVKSGKPEAVHEEKPYAPKPREFREQTRPNNIQSSPHPQLQHQDKSYQNNKTTRVGTGRITKPKRELSDGDYRGFTKSRQFKSTPPNKTPGSRGPIERQPNSSTKNSSVHEIEREMAKVNIQENYKAANVKHNNTRQGSVPPRLQGEQKGSKRYSSIRQRSLPETANPPFAQHNYYGNDYNQQAQTSQPPPPSAIIPNNTIHASTAPIPQIPNPTLPPIPAQVPVTTTPLLQGPPQFAPPFPPAGPFLQAGVPPASFIPPQNAPTIINYGQPQYQAPFQGYQQQFGTVNQPPELYQPQGGITYYSAQEQQQAQRSVPQKRPKAAIPIVAPSENRGRGRSNQQQPQQQQHHQQVGEPTPEPAESVVVEASVVESEKFEDAVAAQ